MTNDKCSVVVHTIEDGRGAWDACIGPGPGPDDMGAGCAGAELDDGIIGGICSVCRCNIAYKRILQRLLDFSKAHPSYISSHTAHAIFQPFRPKEILNWTLNNEFITHLQLDSRIVSEWAVS